jgi:hypothetical protein
VTRRRPRRAAAAGLGLAMGLAAVAALVVALAVSGGQRGPAIGAARVVPADALAYVNLSLDRSRPAVRQALALSRRFPDFPLFMAAVESRLGRAAGVTDLTAAVRPWIGGEAAIALLRSSARRGDALAILAIRRRRAFTRFLAQATPGTVGQADGFALIGSPAAVAQAQAVARGQVPALAASTTFGRASAGEDAGRVLDAYLPASGLAPLLGGRGGLAGGLGLLLDQRGLEGLSLSLTAVPGGARARLHSVYAPGRSLPRAVDPTLQHVVPSGSALLLDVPSLRAAAPTLLAAGSVAGIGGQVGPLLTRLGAALRSEGVDVARVEALFDHESAVAVTSVASQPGLLVLARAPDPARARVQLAALEPSLASLFSPASSGPGAAPVFSDRQVAGIDIHSLQLAPGLTLGYAVFGHLIALSTSSAAIVSVVRRTRSVGSDRGYAAVLGGDGGQPRPVTSLVFLDLSQLIRLGRQIGLLGGGGARVISPDASRIRFAGVRTFGGSDESTAELLLSIP